MSTATSAGPGRVSSTGRTTACRCIGLVQGKRLADTSAHLASDQTQVWPEWAISIGVPGEQLEVLAASKAGRGVSSYTEERQGNTGRSRFGAGHWPGRAGGWPWVRH